MTSDALSKRLLSLSGDRQSSTWSRLIPYLVFGVLTALAAFIGGLATANSTDSAWYRNLAKPSFNPPNWVFGPVWTLLYAMMAFAGGLVWRKGVERRDVRVATGLFGIQLTFNTVWSILFFGMRSPAAGLIEIAGLWASIFAWHWSAARVDGRTRWLILPYLAWVSFAAVLNGSIWWLIRE